MGVRGTAPLRRGGGAEPRARGSRTGWGLETKNLITTGRYNPQGCGMLDSGGSRCQASLKLGRADRGVWCGVIKFASWSMLARNESKRGVARPERLDPASETQGRLMLGRENVGFPLGRHSGDPSSRWSWVCFTFGPLGSASSGDLLSSDVRTFLNLLDDCERSARFALTEFRALD